MDFSRRWFIGGVASFGAFSGCRFFSSNAWREGGAPNVAFGVVSDVHISAMKGSAACAKNVATFRHTLEWFRDQGVDAVVIAGDIADHGMIDQLQVVADTWNEVFPDNRAPDGRRVEKVFVYGNHDWEGSTYGSFAERNFPDKAERARHVLRADYAGNWQRIFDEPYARIYSKCIKGYTFIGQHWDGLGRKDGFSLIAPYLETHAKTLDPAQPFFYVQHPHPRNTCYGSWAWGHDSGDTTKALSNYSNAIAFSGHSHYSLTDERSVWQGAFTSVGTSSLRYTGEPYNEFEGGFENTNSAADQTWRYDPYKVMSRPQMFDCRQGMLWRVYGDRIVVRRREFVTDTDVGDDWVMPLPVAESKPFAFAERAKHFTAPKFPTGAKVTVRRIQAKTRGKQSRVNSKKSVAPTDVSALELKFPAPLADKQARVYYYDVVAAFGDRRVSRRILAHGFNHAVTHPKVKKAVTCAIPLVEFGDGLKDVAALTVSVTPVGFFGHRGEAIHV